MLQFAAGVVVGLGIMGSAALAQDSGREVLADWTMGDGVRHICKGIVIYKTDKHVRCLNRGGDTP